MLQRPPGHVSETLIKVTLHHVDVNFGGAHTLLLCSYDLDADTFSSYRLRI